VRTERHLCLTLLLAAACTAPDPGAAADPLDAELAARIEAGRALLDSGSAEEAETLFASAARDEGDSLRTRMWVLRAWMEQGRSNDTLDALDALDRAGARGPEMDYLYGMAFARRAESYLAQGVTDSSVQMNFLDATDFLDEAVAADAQRFRDAFLPLATSAWYVQETEKARWAADRAVEFYPASPEAWSTRGKIAMTQFMAEEGAASGSEAAERAWSEAARSFRRSVELYGVPGGADRRAALAQAATQLGHAMVWRKKGPEATEAYATAIAVDPQAFDYSRTAELLGGTVRAEDDDRPCGFRAALESAVLQQEAAGLAADPGRATLDWWLGWARFVDADWAGSEAAFLASLARAPEYTNAWFYLGLARQYGKDPSGALAAMHAGWDADPAAMVATAASAGGALRAFEGLIDWCAREEPPRNLDAAFLAEMLAQAMPSEARHWNNLGLFLRDEGERLEIEAHEKKTPEPDPALLADLYERAFAAYERALELNPEDPQLVNDTAVMMHYHLGREPEECAAMYRRAIELSDGLLARPDLSSDDRARYETTRGDAETNLKHLLEPEPVPGAAAGAEGPASETEATAKAPPPPER
jgi:tetratricopeptide (TPR) repeat protein